MKETEKPPVFPEREELRDLPKTPRLVNEISRLLRARVHGAREAGVTAQSSARLLIAHLAVLGESSQRTLAERTHLRPPTVSILLRELEDEGYLSRRQSEEDRRTVLVSLTEKGKRYDKDRLSLILTNDEIAMKDFTKEEEALLESLLLRVRENLKEGGKS